MKVKGEGIKQLIPQRFPMMMVDEFETVDGQSAVTALPVRSGNYFLLSCGELSETGLIEHSAQSCSALAGYQCQQQGSSQPPIGMIAEVKHFRCSRRPVADEKITTQVVFSFSFGNMIIAHCHSSVDSEQVAETELKIFIQ